MLELEFNILKFSMQFLDGSKLVDCRLIGYWVCLILTLSAIIKARGMVCGVLKI